MTQKFNFTKAITEIEEINRWFQEADIDLEAGLVKLRRGKQLIHDCRDRLKDVENEFVKIKMEFETNDTASTNPDAEETTDTDLPF